MNDRIENEAAEKIDLTSMFKDVLREWWVILLISLSVAFIADIWVNVTYQPEYKTSTTFIVTAKGMNSNVYQNLSTTQNLAERLRLIMPLMTIQISALCGRLINRMTKISFIIPVYNCKNYLPGCIESIDKIGLSNYEILLIDDGSTDGSGELCENMSSIRNHVRYVHQSNQGVSAARNVGLDYARGEYVLFIDADDSFDSQGMKKVINYLTDETIDLIIYGMSFEFYYKGMVYRSDDMKTPLSGILNETEWISYLRDLYFANSLSPIWNKVYKRKLLVDNKLKFKEDMFLYEDFEFSLRYLTYSGKVLFIPDALYHYRQSEDEGNSGRRLKRIAHIPQLIDRIEVAAEELLKKKTVKKTEVKLIRFCYLYFWYLPEKR